MHPWHHVNPEYNAAEATVYAVIEIPKGSRAKYEVHKGTGLLMLDRVLYSSVHYPANYGFIPQSYGDDRDPLDILVLCQESVSPLCMVKARIIGVMRMMDRGEGDEKILAVAEGDPSLSHVRDLNNLPDHFLQEVRNFFETYKILENKTVAIDALSDRATALPIVEGAFAKYRDEILPGLKG